MNAENIGICITPGLIRHPNKSEMNMEEMYKTNQVERAFVEKLLQVDLSSSTWSKQSSTKSRGSGVSRDDEKTV
jgi:hypothetical protein